ncbi:hypothetical protein [Brevundimonas sp.]|jgi:hypothetical protein|uniref:hypothetical protein n=1 Tax=Brevundimonas sp. TaxID=1871086 RepID=UPI0035167497
MLAALALAAVVVTAEPRSADTVTPAVAAFSTACLDVRGDRTAFEAVADAQGWSQVEAAPRNNDWIVSYRSAGLIIRLSQYQIATAGGEAVPGRICAVDRIEAGPDWEQQVSALKVDGRILGKSTLPDPDIYQIPPGMEVRVWDLSDGSRIHASFIPARSYLELSINYPTGT